MNTNLISDLLKREFVSRCNRNESYSIRAFARFLDIDHSQLAKILKGQLALSKKMSYEVGDKLSLSQTQIKDILESDIEISESKQIDNDIMCVLADWFHFAILELIKIETFSYSIPKISETLSISHLEAEMAVERLERLGFLEVENDCVKLLRVNNNWFDHHSTSGLKKHLQKELLRKALVSIDEIEFEDRINSSLTVAINDKELKEFRVIVQDFINQIDKKSESKTSVKNSVYQLCVAFFPLTSRIIK